MSLKVLCPGGRPVISGGVHITGSSLTIKVASTAPVDGSDNDNLPDDGWRATAINNSGETESMTVRAQCAGEAARKHLRYVSRTGTVQSQSADDRPAYCADDSYHVIAGGVSISGTSTDVHILHNEPLDDANHSDGVPNDLWYGLIANWSDDEVTMKVTAICLSLGRGLTYYAFESRDIATGQQASVSVSCPSGIALGGGGGTSAGIADFASLEMRQGPDGSSNGWLAWFNNLTVEEARVYVRAICWVG
jgi:hypothetical protein